MRELIASVASVQESAVTQLPQTLQPGSPPCEPALVPPLPLGPNERHRYHADGGVETATAAEIGLESKEEDEDDEHKLYYYVPTNAQENAWQEAERPELPLRNNAGQEVTEEEWVAEHNDSEKKALDQKNQRLGIWEVSMVSPRRAHACRRIVRR